MFHRFYFGGPCDRQLLDASCKVTIEATRLCDGTICARWELQGEIDPFGDDCDHIQSPDQQAAKLELLGRLLHAFTNQAKGGEL